MIEQLDLVREVAEETRADFERGLVMDEEVLEAATIYNEGHSIRSLGPPRGLTEEEAAQYYFVGTYRLRKPLVQPEIFPKSHCDIATLVLRRRVEAAGIDGESTLEIIHGGCGEDMNPIDMCHYYHNYHTFLGLGHTILGRDIIVDITGDQFREVTQPVYIGPLVDPWTRDPRIDMYEPL